MYEQPKALRDIFEPNISDCCHLAHESHHDPRSKEQGTNLAQVLSYRNLLGMPKQSELAFLELLLPFSVAWLRLRIREKWAFIFLSGGTGRTLDKPHGNKHILDDGDDHDRRHRHRSGDFLFVGVRRDSCGIDRARSVITAGKNRMRPISMTTFVSILALMPLALGIDHGAAMQ
jgi:hypothetical protein